MAVTRIGTADDRAEWLERRKRYLGASEVFSWREEDHPSWWEDKRASILAEKLDGVPKEFPWEAQVSINHGTFSEQDIARKLGDALGAEVETDNSQFVNDRWPHIAATVDGFLHPPHTEERGPDYCQDPSVLPDLRAQLIENGETCILELKRSTSAGWQKAVPVYYISQVQTQLHVLEMEWAVICADTLKRQGYRTYWDLRPYLIRRDPAWGRKLDRVEKEVAQALGAC